MELPPGFRFHPTDEELITHYLSPEVLNSQFCTGAIGEADLNKYEPWNLPSRFSESYSLRFFKVGLKRAKSNGGFWFKKKQPGVMIKAYSEESVVVFVFWVSAILISLVLGLFEAKISIHWIRTLYPCHGMAGLHLTVTECRVKMEIDVPTSVAYDRNSDRESIPRWMPFISSVKILEDKPDLSRWSLKYKAFGRDIEFSWLARNMQPIPNQKIHWRSLEGLPNRGAVRFYPKGPSACIVELTVSYEVPQLLAPVASALQPFLEGLLVRGLERFATFAKSKKSRLIVFILEYAIKSFIWYILSPVCITLAQSAKKKGVEKNLRQVELDAIQDYIKESDNLVSLHDQIPDCDGILSQMETLLCGYKVFWLLGKRMAF
ncbi:hypothetical protein FNV43_RR20480 [Rhamnella rubrinervis]|uniref:NAC domain-containing protein n=1 Tax=Rhamnella rubrinervis TaxID=2594499 RepID=A0A8K0GTF3_9ROSA|nr:hypothetical protein FNV43_RR20480 [Rhamnella rubrinervis]